MPATYAETLEKLQTQGLETLKQAQSIQLAALSTVRDAVANLPAVPAVPSAESIPTFSELAQLNVTFAQKVLEQQSVFALQLADLFGAAHKDAAATADRFVKSSAQTAQTVQK
ncbi:MAG TPA: hypothetical protein VFB22_02210 [Candidatus Baltobacteraceae bacterium]|nr:hypothetical protein [Candidatus Baltobacteraceae bacterium]